MATDSQISRIHFCDEDIVNRIAEIGHNSGHKIHGPLFGDPSPKSDGSKDKNENAHEYWYQLYLSLVAADASDPMQGQLRSLLPFSDIEGTWSPTRLIGRELHSIDLLFMDTDGLLTVVETKLLSNAEAKRTVVAQVLDYAALLRTFDFSQLCEAIATQPESYAADINPLFELRGRLAEELKRQDSDAEFPVAHRVLCHYLLKGSVPETLAAPGSREYAAELELYKNTNAMLAAASFRLVIVTDRANPALLRLINFQLALMGNSNCQLVVVEMSPEHIAGRNCFAPHILGASSTLNPVYYRQASKAQKQRVIRTFEEVIRSRPQKVRDELWKLREELSNDARFSCETKAGFVTRYVDATGRLQRAFGLQESGLLVVFHEAFRDKCLGPKYQEIKDRVTNELLGGKWKGTEPNFELKTPEQVRTIRSILHDAAIAANQDT